MRRFTHLPHREVGTYQPKSTRPTHYLNISSTVSNFIRPCVSYDTVTHDWYLKTSFERLFHAQSLPWQEPLRWCGWRNTASLPFVVNFAVNKVKEPQKLPDTGRSAEVSIYINVYQVSQILTQNYRRIVAHDLLARFYGDTYMSNHLDLVSGSSRDISWHIALYSWCDSLTWPCFLHQGLWFPQRLVGMYHTCSLYGQGYRSQ